MIDEGLVMAEKIVPVKNPWGLVGLFTEFGNRVIYGPKIREVMLSAATDAGIVASGWNASKQLGRLVRAGYLTETKKKPGENRWDLIYRFTDAGVKAVDVIQHGGPEIVYDEEKDPTARALRSLNEFAGSLGDKLGRRAKVDEMGEYEFREMLRVGMTMGYLRVTVRLTESGVDVWDEHGDFNVG